MTHCDDPPPCPTCGYNLTTLPTRGICPECGRFFDLAKLRGACAKPRFGWLGLLLPPASAVVVEVATRPLGTAGSVIAVVALVGVGLVWPCFVAARLANWRHHVRTAAAIENFRRPPMEEGRVGLIVALLAAELITTLAALGAGAWIAGWCVDQGYF